ncbi:hypothetical protein DERP_009828 [Dermatophagoides pteronyssinus]|uniref:Uncharacterized protein n=1 Tax=Dermatophagoides pteronyssinus TaxID=6956 RepID=A0ABQ8IR95_DERPT|nr:hypothetical protein DERP_009828 [Dermatophagoides pteronyssinus]
MNERSKPKPGIIIPISSSSFLPPPIPVPSLKPIPGIYDCKSSPSSHSSIPFVSKLNVKPFQRVNSPLDDPVIKRRPSGVHRTQNIGQRILFVDVRTNFVVIQLAALFCIYIGGTIYRIRF